MLQQTRVATAIPYYKRFLERFPTTGALASAGQQEVLMAWEGLGYYSRARNLQFAAQTVMEEFDGKIPSSYDEIRSLKGIGPYTASAILSIAFGLPYAVVDGNVIRVLARYYGIEEDIRSQKTKRLIQELADEILDRSRPGEFNQAVMELGATICTPTRPDCMSCPISADCTAYRTSETDTIPYKSPAKKIPHHTIGVGLIMDKSNRILIARRPEKAMLGGLWEFPGGKQKNGESVSETVARELKEELGVDVEVLEEYMSLRHVYSHFKITLHACWCRILSGTPEPNSSTEIRWVTLDQLEDFPFPKANRTLTRKLIRDKIGND